MSPFRFKSVLASAALALVAVSTVAPATHAQTILGPIANPFNGHSYYAVRIANFTDYRNQATALGGYPAVINNADENTWVFNNIVDTLPAGENAYIGFSDAAVEGEWRWEAGVVDRYTNWNPGEPNNFGGNQNWAIMQRTAAGRWDDWIAPAPFTPAGNPNPVLPAAIVEVPNGANPDPTGILFGPVTNPANGHDYYVLSPGNFLAAGRFASNSLPAGAALASIDNADENLWVTNNLLSQPGVGTAWIGLNTFYQSTMQWINTSPSTYRRWGAGEPNGGVNQGVVMVATSSPTPGLWSDTGVFQNLPSIIEINYCRTDFDRSGASNIDDIFIFLSAWFAGCP